MKKKGAGKAGFSIHHQGISPELQDEMMNSPPNIPWTLYRPSRNPGEKNKKIYISLSLLSIPCWTLYRPSRNPGGKK
jgi:hypothetical protein